MALTFSGPFKYKEKMLTDTQFVISFEKLVEQLETDDIRGRELEPCVEKIAELCERFLHRFNGAKNETKNNSV